MRTKFGRLTLKKSGDGAKELTDRDQWILSAFSYPRQHAVWIVSRQTVSFKAEIPAAGKTVNVVDVHKLLLMRRSLRNQLMHQLQQHRSQWHYLPRYPEGNRKRERKAND